MAESAKAVAKKNRELIMSTIMPQMKLEADGWIHGLHAEIVKVLKVGSGVASSLLASLVKLGQLEIKAKKSQLYRLSPKPGGREAAIAAGTRNLARANARKRLLKSDALEPLIRARISQLDGEIEELATQMAARKAERDELRGAL